MNNTANWHTLRYFSSFFGCLAIYSCSRFFFFLSHKYLFILVVCLLFWEYTLWQARVCCFKILILTLLRYISICAHSGLNLSTNVNICAYQLNKQPWDFSAFKEVNKSIEVLEMSFIFLKRVCDLYRRLVLF